MKSTVLMKVFREEHVKLEQELQQKLDKGMTKEELAIQDPVFVGRMYQMNTITLRFIAEGGLEDGRTR